MERVEVQGMVDLAIAKYHAENVARLTSIEDRIIGIDGNGTGRKGAIQRLEDKMEDGFAMAVTQLEGVRKTVSGLTFHTFDEDNVSKKRIRAVLVAVVGAIAVAALSFVSGLGVEWMKHIKGW